MIYGSIRVHMGPYGPIFVARGEKSQVKKVKINISDRDFFLGLFQGDAPGTAWGALPGSLGHSHGKSIR